MNYNVTKIRTELADLVGFESTTGFTLTAPLVGATFSMNSYHPLLELETLDNIRPENRTLTDWLISVRNSSTTSLLNDLMTSKLSAKTIKTTLSSNRIFDSEARFSNLEQQKGRFVGWTFRPYGSDGIQHKISKIAIQLKESEEDLPIYIYHSSQLEPIGSRLIQAPNPTSVNWTLLEDPIILSYSEHSGGYYFIGYFEDDLKPSNRAIFKDHNLSVSPCSSCNYFNIASYKEWSKYLRISSKYISSDKLDGTNLVSTEDISSDVNRNWGLNFFVESSCDITDFLVRNKGMLAPALQVRYAIDLLRYVEMSGLRSNVITDTMREAAFVAINGQKSENNYIKLHGLIHTYESYLKGLDFDLSDLDPVCIASTRIGIRYK